MGHADLEHWLERNRKRFNRRNITLCWRAIFDSYCTNGGRMSGEFRSAVIECGYDVVKSAAGDFYLGKVK